jgi:hypothetical protein
MGCFLFGEFEEEGRYQGFVLERLKRKNAITVMGGGIFL